LAESTSVAPTAALKSDFEKKFYEGIAAIKEGNYSAAAEMFLAVRHLALASGIEQHPEFATLLRQESQRLVTLGKIEDANFVLRQAIEFSSADASLNLAFANESTLPASERSGLTKAAWGMVSSDFLTLVSWIFSGLFAVLTALTLALIMTVVVFLCHRLHEVYDYLFRVLPRGRRGYLAPVALLLGLVTPLVFGVLGALSCWSLMLMRATSGLRRLPVLVGITSLLWGLAIPVTVMMSEALDSKLVRAVGSLNIGGPLPSGSLPVLAEAIKERPNDPLLQFYYARALLSAGKWVEADKLFQEVQERDQGGAVEIATLTNRAAIAYNDNNFSSAILMLEKASAKNPTFESLYNLSIAHLAALDTAGHRRAYESLLGLDKKRLERLGKITAGGKSPPLYAGLSGFRLLPLCFKQRSDSGVAGKSPLPREFALTGALLLGSSPTLLVLFGLLVMVAGLMMPISRNSFTAGSAESGSVGGFGYKAFAWVEDPLGSVVIWGCLSWFLIVFYQSPVHLRSIHPGIGAAYSPISVGLCFALCACAVLAVVVSNFTRANRAQVGGG